VRVRSVLERFVGEFAFVGEHMAVSVPGRGEVALPDVLADSRPRRSAKVKQADPAVPTSPAYWEL